MYNIEVAAQTERIIFIRDGKIVSEIKLLKFNGANIDNRMKEVTEKMRGIGI